MPFYSVRPKRDLSSLLGVVEEEVVVNPICEVCYQQGIIAAIHPDSEQHKGSPHFKPFVPDAAWYRRRAAECEAKAAELEVR